MLFITTLLVAQTIINAQDINALIKEIKQAPQNEKCLLIKQLKKEIAKSHTKGQKKALLKYIKNNANCPN